MIIEILLIAYLVVAVGVCCFVVWSFWPPPDIESLATMVFTGVVLGISWPIGVYEVAKYFLCRERKQRRRSA